MAAAPDPRKLHSVKYGTNNIGANTPANKIPAYMSDQQSTFSPYDAEDTTQTLNRELLQIISQGINNIVNNLKNKLGNNFTESNQSSLAIKKRLDDLKKEIDDDIGKNLANPDLNAIYINPRNNYEVITGDGYLRPLADPSQPQINVSNIDIASDYQFNRLNDKHRSVLTGYDQTLLYGETETTFNQAEIENRLKNCQNLEFLYLKKHDEIMKIFAFTINLFDKYKYAIKIILLLLKNLVYKDGTGTVPPPPPPQPGTQRIRIPIPIIPNIKKLLDDQKNIQHVIDKMKTVISPDPKQNPDPDMDIAKENIKVQKLTDQTNVSENNINLKLKPTIAQRPAAYPRKGTPP